MADWRSLFSTLPNQTLAFHPSEIRNGSPVVAPPKEIFERGAEEWKHSLVAQFLGNPPGLNVLRRTLPKLWEKKSTVMVKQAGSNLYILQLDSDEACNWVLENGPCHVQHDTMIIRKWTPNTGKLHFDLNKMLVWFHLHNIPLELYTRDGISYLASAIGNPLYMDSITASQKRLEYAKVCIEVCADHDPPEEIAVELEDGNITTIAVSIPWKPLVCKTCKTFGHSGLICAKRKQTSYGLEKETVVTAENVTLGKEPVIENLGVIASQVLDKIPDEPEATSNTPAHPALPKTTPGSSKTTKKKPNWTSNTKHSITSSSNKYASLLDDKEEDGEELIESLNEKEVEDNTNEAWKHLVENATYSPRKSRAASKGFALVMNEVKGQKAKVVARGGKKPKNQQ